MTTQELLTRIQTLTDVCTLIQEELAILKGDVLAATATMATGLAPEVTPADSASQVGGATAPPTQERRVRRGAGRKSVTKLPAGMTALTLED